MKLLIVDSDPLSREILSSRFEISGWQCRTAEVVDEAYALLKEEAADLVITEVTLLGSTGYELCHLIRASEDPELRSTPVIILSFLEKTEDIVEGLNSGADEYIVKPFDFLELDARINALFRRTNNTYGT